MENEIDTLFNENETLVKNLMHLGLGNFMELKANIEKLENLTEKDHEKIKDFEKLISLEEKFMKLGREQFRKLIIEIRTTIPPTNPQTLINSKLITEKSNFDNDIRNNKEHDDSLITKKYIRFSIVSQYLKYLKAASMRDFKCKINELKTLLKEPPDEQPNLNTLLENIENKTMIIWKQEQLSIYLNCINGTTEDFANKILTNIISLEPSENNSEISLNLCLYELNLVLSELKEPVPVVDNESKRVLLNYSNWIIRPACVEKYLTRIQFYAKCAEIFPINPKENIIKLLKKVDKRYQNGTERLNYSNKNKLQQIKQNANLTLNDWKILHNETKDLLKNITHLFVEEIKTYVAKCNSEVEKISDSNTGIIMLLGKTGSGKSTLCHYLCKSEFRRINDIKPITNNRYINLINEVQTSIGTDSVTEFIYSIPLISPDIPEKEIIYLIDTPGFQDTRGLELEISNSAGIIYTLNRAKSVRLIVLIKPQDLGSRCQDLSQFLTFLSIMFPDLTNYPNSLMFCLTNFEGNILNEFEVSVKQIIDKENLNPDSKISKILERIQNGMVIDPINDDIEKKHLMLNNILAMNGIKPNEANKNDRAFKFSLLPPADNAICNKLKYLESSVEKSCFNDEIPLALSWIKDIIFFKNITGTSVNDENEKNKEYYENDENEKNHNTLKSYTVIDTFIKNNMEIQENILSNIPSNGSPALKNDNFNKLKENFNNYTNIMKKNVRLMGLIQFIGENYLSNHQPQSEPIFLIGGFLRKLDTDGKEIGKAMENLWWHFLIESYPYLKKMNWSSLFVI